MSSVVQLTRAQSRQVDAIAIHTLGIAGIVLMENAGRGVVDVMEQVGVAGPVVIACGRGNNAGDGFVMARHLQLRGYQPRVWMWSAGHALQGDAAVNHAILSTTGISVSYCVSDTDWARFDQELDGADWIVDALLGTGATGAPRSPFDKVLRRMNAAQGKKLAVDAPSGLDCDSGVASDPTFRANHTCTFVAAKPGLTCQSSGQFVGVLHVVDIGLSLDMVLPLIVD